MVQTDSQTNEKIDLQFSKLYTLDWSKPGKVIKLYGYDVMMPVEPPDKDCINYKKPIDKQIFRKTLIPEDLAHWEEAERDFFVFNEFHRRKNGVWIFIKGQKLWIPGICYYYLNYWTSQANKDIMFRFTDLEFFWMWIHCVRDPRCYGLIDFKCRQIGDTEKVLCIIYEYCSRVRNVKAAMQSIKDTHIEKSYLRMVYAHNQMVWFMKPLNKGTDNPAEGLIFKYPSQLNSIKKIKEQHNRQGTANTTGEEFEYKELNSEIQYGPSNEQHFDGQTWGRYYMDEFGKMDRMDPIEAWGVIKPALYSDILGRFVGKGIMTSTVEETKGGKSLKWAKQLWDDSDPDKRDDNGFTTSGLYRIFRSALDRAPTDKWGFPKVDEQKSMIENTVKGFLARKNMKGLIKFKRKHPLNIRDVFMSTQDESQFHIENLTLRQYYLEYQASPKPWVRGNLKWEDAERDTRVIWEPNPNGRWLISHHPHEYGVKDNSKTFGVRRAKPGNTAYFCMGVDPYDQKSVLTSSPSLGGIAVKRRYDKSVDCDESLYYQFDDPEGNFLAGDPVDGGVDFQTNRFVCTYLERPEDPNDFYEDIIMTAVYYGTDFLPEKNKSGGLKTYLDLRKYNLYLMEREKSKPNPNSKNQVERDGVTAQEGTIDEYFSYIETFTCKWWNTIDHPDLLEQWLSMNWENRTEKDLGVAAGWCEYASKVKRSKPKEKTNRQIRYFTENVV